MVEAAVPVWSSSLIGERIAQETAFPAQLAPEIPDGSVDLVRAGLGGPVNRSPLKSVIAAVAIRGGRLIREGVAQKAFFCAECEVLAQDCPIDRMCTGLCRRVGC